MKKPLTYLDLEREEREAIKEMFDVGPRVFTSGATRSPMGDKLCYSGFLSPVVLKRFAQYMHLHRKQSDGTLRASDNWQSGIPLESYEDSLIRHIMDVWLWKRGFYTHMEEDIETALCGVLFNTQGMLFEILKGKADGSCS